MRATVYVSDVSGSSPMARLTNTPHSQARPDWSPDGRFVLFQQTSSEGKFDLWYVSVSGARNATPFRETPYQEFGGRFSPDGKWVAYTADQTGRQEIWVEAFPPATQKQQVSTDGGTDPVWRKDGRELFYRSSAGSLMTVPVRYESGMIRFGPPAPLFAIDAKAYDVSADGARFLTLSNVRSSEVSPLTFFLNWRQKLDVRH
jgi:Tol biopolymer transport system component